MNEAVLIPIDQIDKVHTVGQLAGVLRELRRRDSRRRRAREYSYRELAAATGWSHTAIGDYFAGKTVPPSGRFDVLIQMLGASGAEQRLLATARDRAGERHRAPAGAPRGAGIRLGGSALVGRDPELAQLRRHVHAVVGGRGGAAFLLGEAGIGKTRLTAEAGAIADRAGLTVLRGRAATPVVQFRPLSEAILSAMRRTGPPDAPDLQPYRMALSRMVPEWRADHPVSFDDSPVVLAEAVLRLAVALGRPHGTVLVLEDLHDADDDTLAIVDYLVDNAGPERLLLIGTARPGPGTATRLIRAAQRRRAATVAELSRLDDASVGRLAGGCLGVRPDRVPEPVTERLVATADGVPLHVEELLAAMVLDGTLVEADDGWRLAGPVAPSIPVTIAATLTERVDRLRPPGPALLRAAAMLGRQFAVPVAAAAAGVAGPELVDCLREAVEAQLLAPATEAQTYAFRHVLTAEALRSQLLPLERAALARRVAEAMEAWDLGPAAGWGRLLGELWYTAGESRRAAELFGVAGRCAAGEGAVSTAISLLERALSMLDDDEPEGGEDTAADLGAALVDLYAEAGRIADAYAIGTRLAHRGGGSQRAVIHLRLAKAAAEAGDWQRGLRDVTEARSLLGGAPGPLMAAQLDVVAAQLLFGDGGADRHAGARRLAERALGTVDSNTHPEVACGALEILGRIARLDDLSEADRLYHRGLTIAQSHGLVGHRIRMLYQIGAHDGIRDGDPTRLAEALTAANEAGAVVSALDIGLELSVVRLCRGEYGLVEAVAAECEQTSGRLRLTYARLLALGIRIMAAAHQAQRSRVETLLAQFSAYGGNSSDFSSAVHGLGVAFCRLLREDLDGAATELSEAVLRESARPATYVSYIHGPHLLLSVLAGRAGTEECATLAASPQVQARWNRQFLVLARGLLHARAGDTKAADRAMSVFMDLSRCFPLAHHLGLRLAAPTALDLGWGDPVYWLRAAETYFHPFAPEVARACRTMLRRTGAPVPQHRYGSDTIPPAARRYGITVREHEVLHLVSKHLTNPEIGRRLFLSTRTVEKHIANLLAKTGKPDRAELIAFAAEIAAAAEW